VQKYFPFFLLILVNVIYGLNFSIAKLVMPIHIKPLGFVLLRTLSGTIFFWVISLLSKNRNEKIAKEDYLQLLGISVFGIALNQLMFFQGLEYTTSISASIIMTSVPIIVLPFSWIFLNKKSDLYQIFGVLLGFSGSLGLIIYGKDF